MSQESKPNGGTGTEKKTKQRIKMRMYKHPVKHDGTVIEFTPDGKSFVVQFDGPLPDTRFWQYRDSDTLVADKEIDKDDVSTKYSLWEVIG